MNEDEHTLRMAMTAAYRRLTLGKVGAAREGLADALDIPCRPPLSKEPTGDEAALRERLHDLWAGGPRDSGELDSSYHDAVDESVDVMLELVRAHDAKVSA